MSVGILDSILGNKKELKQITFNIVRFTNRGNIMASKDRIQRLKEDTRLNILDAALTIVKKEGWQALSMRKIADCIEYTAPIIYEYFSSKTALLTELTRQGFLLLTQDIELAKLDKKDPSEQIISMWLAYWNFAFANREYYQLMFGVSTGCSCGRAELRESEIPFQLFSSTISKLMKIDDPDSDLVCTKYYTYWSVVHGLISINLVSRGSSDEINKQVFNDAIIAITQSITP